MLSFDQEIYTIIALSMYVSFASTLISAFIGIPLGFILGLKDFKGKRIFARFLNTAMSLPPVVVGLVVTIFLARRGPLGQFRLLFTPAAMIIAQTLLVLPIIMGVIFNSSRDKGTEVEKMCLTLGANKLDTLLILVKEMRANILVAITSGFGRAISEVGAVMIVGGNIKNHTRVMTTFIAMNHSMGNYSTSIAMGLVLLGISFIVNAILYGRITGTGD
ncbi:MAG: ABC transporter permease [Firmicutes bacterium]|nr:ABC transporter permease [Bacillota bacterium]